MNLKPFRVELKGANEYVARLHRHHAPVTGHRFSLGVQKNTGLCGVAICGRPVGRMIPQSDVLEVNRCCTDGTRNACSWLYTAAARCAREMGFRAVITYTNVEEDGASLRACGWWPEVMPLLSDYSFSSSKRERAPKKGKDMGQKIRWLWLTGND